MTVTPNGVCKDYRVPTFEAAAANLLLDTGVWGEIEHGSARAGDADFVRVEGEALRLHHWEWDGTQLRLRAYFT